MLQVPHARKTILINVLPVPSSSMLPESIAFTNVVLEMFSLFIWVRPLGTAKCNAKTRRPICKCALYQLSPEDCDVRCYPEIFVMCFSLSLSAKVLSEVDRDDAAAAAAPSASGGVVARPTPVARTSPRTALASPVVMLRISWSPLSPV